MGELPTGTVTFLFSDIEGSTKLLQRLGPDYARVLGEHQAQLRAAWAAHGGVEVDTQGDSFFVVFASAPAALAAAAQATRALADHAWPDTSEVRVRVGLHTGSPQLVGDHYVGLDVHRAARIAAAGHGGQVLLSETTRALAEHDLPAGATLRDLGAHRLKDLQHAEHLYQLVLPGLPADFPPLKSLDGRPHNLPVQPTPLLGREEALTAVCAPLRRAEVRLVTLTGPGGIGKTRLAIQVAAEVLDDFADGVWFVRLSRLTDPGLVVPTAAQTLGLREQGGRPVAETLRDWLRDRHLLLVLDNFEQVVTAAGEVATLLEASPGLKLLVTSRVPLRLRGEHECPLAPLPLPDPRHLPAPERLSQYTAVALFVERARQARPDFAVTAANAPAIAEICARLDGLPLAIELAAARVRLLPPEALLGRLSSRLHLLTGGSRDLEERQRTMRAAIAWSEGLLGPEERVLFRRLAVFVGGCTLEAAEAVCAAPEGAEPLGIDLLDGLGALVEQSLVQQREEGGEPRFGMLHVIREFALERLEESGEAEALRRAHAACLLGVYEAGEAGLIGPDHGAWFARLERERDNLRAALSWARDRGQAEIGLRLGAALWRFWYQRGPLSEGRAWLDDLLALAAPSRAGGSGQVPATVRARALHASAALAQWGGDIETAAARVGAAVSLAREAGDLRTAAQALLTQGGTFERRGDMEAAAACWMESLAHSRDLEDRRGIAVSLANLAAVSISRGDLDGAAREYEKSLALCRLVGDRLMEGMSLWGLGEVAVRRGDLPKAERLGREALAHLQAVGSPLRIAWGLHLLAATAAASGRGERAARLLGAGASASEAIGSAMTPLEHAMTVEAVARGRTALGEDAWAAAYAAGEALTLEGAVAEALGDTD
jgi:predicted ATPase/class 3 adenylate cyclase